jgi:4-hydroxybenzoate polyprenyltransferase
VGVALAVVALVLAGLSGWRAVLLVAAMLGLGGGYSAGPRPLKASAAGASAVFVLGGLVTYLAGWCAGGGGAPGARVLLVAGVMSLWMGFAGMTKDLPDVDGDRAAGRRTLPVVLGERHARRLTAALTMAVGVAALCATAWLGVLRPFGVTLAAGAALVAAALLAPASPARGARRVPYRCFMVTQYGAHLAIISEVLLWQR